MMWHLDRGCPSPAVSMMGHIYWTLSTLILLHDGATWAFTAQIKRDTKLNHLIKDPETGQLYVGAVNRLFRFDDDLSLLDTVETGPKKDNPACIYPFGNVTCKSAGQQSYQTVNTDNVNKILLLDKVHSQLLTCGSIFQGTCQTFTLNLASNSSYRDDPDYFIAANDADSSTVAFLDNSALYVGATYSGNQENAETRQSVPLVSKRQISGPNIFKYTAYDQLVATGTFLRLSDTKQQTYLISYVSGFGFQGYSYFFTTQKETPSLQNYISKIAQVCQNDNKFTSYIEMPLVCLYDNVSYNLITSAVLTRLGEGLATNLSIASTDHVIVATFVKSQTSSDNVKSHQSAICVYTMNSVRTKFTENLQNCFSQRQKKIGDQFGSNLECRLVQNYKVPTNYCGEMELNSPLAGETPLRSTALMTFSDEAPLTAVAIDVVQNQHTVGFIGTEAGHLKKVLLFSNHQSRQYADIAIDEGSPVNKDMLFSKDRKFLYVMTEHKITKLIVQDCDTYKTCQTCLAPGDPYCGWCSLEKKCSSRTSCKSNSLTNRWLTKKEWCIAITNYQPKLANIHNSEVVTLTITSLPTKNEYQCIYRISNTKVVTDANLTGEHIQCKTPSDLRTKEGQDHLNATLAVRSEDTNVEFLETSFILYTCSEYANCSHCTMSQFPCHWCLYDNQCRDVKADCTQNAGSIGNSKQCPLLVTNSYLLPSGVAQDLLIKARNLPNNQRYVCQLFNENESVQVEATLTDSDTIKCHQLKHSFKSADPHQVFGLKVMWKNDFEIDNYIKNVTVYSCANMASDCTTCIVLPNDDYNCVWCNNSCLYHKSCKNPISDTGMCPQAVIDSIEPKNFTVDGNTTITITGSNIGKNPSDILAVTLGRNKPCRVIKYETSKRILCSTAPASMEKKVKLCIEYLHKDTYLCTKPDLEYRDPKLSSIFPMKGPRSGQTEITISGQSLNTGKKIMVKLGDTPCIIKTRTDEKLVCIKEIVSGVEADKTYNQQIRVTFDNTERTLSGIYFTVYPDPNITNIEPLKTFKSGGRKVTIIGKNLNTTIRPTVRLIKNGRTSQSEACDQSAKRLICTYPADPDLSSKHVKRDDVTYSISLDIDAVQSVQNISAFFPNVSDKVIMYPDPIYYPFNDTKIIKGESLSLTGKYLNLACKEDEVTVLIGKKKCKVDSLKVEKLLCTLPKDWYKQTKSPVKLEVLVGNLKFDLGKLAYKDPVDQLIWIISSSVGGGTLIFIIIIIIIVYKRRSADVERQNKKLQIQLDTLESNVRNECKQAFAELQTEVSDFTSDLNVIGIPFWDYKMYTFRVLFPGFKTHAVLQDRNKSSTSKFGGYDQGLHQFNQLLNSKQFLLIFIRTLEQQKHFSIRDKSTVASLLMIVLQDKMEYATEILKALLDELIDRSVEKKHPKLMLRRTESVVEKLLSNWLSLSMYTYLKKHAGKMLFMLYKAIKHQTEKGPVDVFTAEAKYSLSEDRLLREKVEPKTLTLHVLMNDMKEPVTFKALDCDTITQAKEKAVDAIYMNAPFSSRPSVHNLDLEWHSGRSGQLVLQDEDVTTNLIQGWKRVNTLSHYHVPDGAMLVLTPADHENDMIRQVHGMIEITNSQSSLPPIITVEEGTKVWHLVKHDDNQNLQRVQKVISEIFLTRLLTTKGTLQQYIDDLFMTILRADSALPPAVKYLFDFLDRAARRHNIIDPDVVHTWKSNSLPLRFWVNIIKNPEFIFDIHKSNIVDSCLSVIAQTFMDSCSTVEHRLGKDSPSNKLLFAKDIPRYRGWVGKFYKSVQDMAPISDQEMTRVMTEMSMTNLTDFNVAVALQELYKYAMQYNFELVEALDVDPSAKRLHLANRFEQVQAVIAGTPSY